jgi:hypothetical protein
MSLLRLLTSGKSLDGSKDSASRYQVTRQRLLPKFGLKARDGANAGGGAGAPGVAGRDAGEPRVAGTDAGAPGAMARAGAGADKVEDKVQDKGARRNLLGWWQPKAARPAIPNFHKPMVQGELSLDSVKVVRNDLRDSDLEILAGGRVQANPTPATRQSAGTAAAEAGKSVPALPGTRVGRSLGESAWSRVTERLFGVGK